MAQEPNEVKKVLECYIYAAVEPSAEQISGFKDFLANKYKNREIELEFKMDKTIGKGFKLIAGDDIYDWTEVGRFAQFKDFMEGIRTGGTLSGDGRYDICMIPRNPKYPGIIMELKSEKGLSDKALETLSFDALKQIDDRGYDNELKVEGVINILKLGIAFSGKKVMLTSVMQ